MGFIFLSSKKYSVADYIAFIDNGSIILRETTDNLIYEYGIARLKESEFNQFDEHFYIAIRKRGMQYDMLVNNKI